MNTIGEEASNVLDASSDLLDLLRLSHGALHRIKRQVHGDCFESADVLAKKLLALREEAESLDKDIINYVKDIESKKYGS